MGDVHNGALNRAQLRPSSVSLSGFIVRESGRAGLKIVGSAELNALCIKAGLAYPRSRAVAFRIGFSCPKLDYCRIVVEAQWLDFFAKGILKAGGLIFQEVARSVARISAHASKKIERTLRPERAL
jgi:hypothetical protein